MPVRAFIIRLDTERAEPVDIVADPGGSTHLASLGRALDCRFVDRVTLESDVVDAWLDDEYLYFGAERDQVATDVLRAYGVDYEKGGILGSVVFAGHDGVGRMRSLTEREQAVCATPCGKPA
jgi:predicted transcriptional regulator